MIVRYRHKSILYNNFGDDYFSRLFLLLIHIWKIISIKLNVLFKNKLGVYMKKQIYFFPVIFIIMLFIIIPLISIVISSLGNLDLLFSNELMFSLKKTFKISFLVLIITMTIGIYCGLYMAFNKNKFTSFLLYLLLFSSLVSGIIRLIPWISILSKEGIINNLLLTLHLIKEPLHLVYNDFSTVLGFVYILVPLVCINIYTSAIKIDKNLFLAAKTLKVSKFNMYRKIIIPQLYDEIILSSLLTFTISLTLYSIPKFLGSSEFVLSVFLQRAVSSVNYSMAIIISILLIFISFISLLISNILIKRKKWSI